MSTSANRGTWLWIGAWQGAKLSFMFALAYILYIAFAETGQLLNLLPSHLIAWITNTPPPDYSPNDYLASLQNKLEVIPAVMMIGMLIGGIPALIIGVVSGVGIAGLLSYPAVVPSPKTRLIVGALFGIIVTLLVSVVSLMVSPGAIGPMVLIVLIGVPSLIYIGACLWLSHQIPILVERKHAKEFPVKTPPLSS
jgi:hypothetical protein